MAVGALAVGGLLLHHLVALREGALSLCQARKCGFIVDELAVVDRRRCGSQCHRRRDGAARLLCFLGCVACFREGALSLRQTCQRGFIDEGHRVGFFGIGSGLNCMMLGVEW